MAELGFVKSKPSDIGRPPYSPSDMLKLYIYGYFNKVRSSRKLEIESGRNIEFMWLLNNLKPDHKTIAQFRKDNLARIAKINKHISEYLTEVETNDNDDRKICDDGNVSEIVEELRARKAKYEDILNTMEETGETQISLTNPDSRLLTKLNSHKMAYNVQTAVDGDNAMIVDLEVVHLVS